MSGQSAGERTEAATPKRKRDAARDGDVLQSRDLGTALVMGGGLLWLAIYGADLGAAAQLSLRRGLDLSHDDVTAFDLAERLAWVALPYAAPLAALLVLAAIAAIAATGVLGSLGFRSAAFAPKASKLSPVAGMKRIFGAEAVAELGKTLIKTALIAGVGGFGIFAVLPQFLEMGGSGVEASSTALGALLVRATGLLVLSLVLVGVGDALMQFRRRATRLRMSKHDVREEMKEAEGSPETRHAAQARRQDLLAMSMRRGVEEATVVLTNPTHFAVALRYRPGKDFAPVVTARGRGDVASTIRTLAAEAQVPLLEYPALTRAIYFSSRAGHTVKDDLFAAVATVLAFVYRLDRSLCPPEVVVPTARRVDADGRRQG
jgi:flagellar biosynthesis protein FlhB